MSMQVRTCIRRHGATRCVSRRDPTAPDHAAAASALRGASPTHRWVAPRRRTSCRRRRYRCRTRRMRRCDATWREPRTARLPTSSISIFIIRARFNNTDDNFDDRPARDNFLRRVDISTRPRRTSRDYYRGGSRGCTGCPDTRPFVYVPFFSAMWTIAILMVELLISCLSFIFGI